MAVTGGAWHGRFQVGIDIDQSPNNPSSATKSVTLTVRFYVRTSYNSINDGMYLQLAGPGTGGDRIGFNMTTPNNHWRHVATRKYTRSLSYNSGYTAKYAASLSGVFNGANPREDRNWGIPRRPIGSPSRPGKPSIYQIDHNSALAKWGAPAVWNGSSLDFYRIEADNHSNFSSINFSDTSTNREHYITGLAPGTKYYVRIRAGTNGGPSPNSYTTAFVTKTQPPNAPVDLHENDVTATGAELDWIGGGTNGTSVTSFTVQYARNSSFTGAITTNTTTSSKAIGNLTRRTTYWWRVKANSAAGSSNYSSINSFTTNYARPTAPSGLDSSEQTHDTVTLNWVTPTDNGGDSIDTYKVQRSTNSAFTSGVVTTSTGTTPSAVISGLATNTVYYWRVLAHNVVGDGPWSPVLMQGTATGVPGVPTSITTTDITNSSATTNVGPPASNGGSEITGYQGQLSHTFDFAVIVQDTGEEVEPPFDWFDLERNTGHYMRVRAFNANGPGPWSSIRAWTTLTGPPGAPGTPVASGITPNQYTVTATPPVDDGDMPIVGYQWQFTNYDPAVMWDDPEGHDAVDQEVLAPVTRLSREPDTQYLVRVAAINANGVGEWSGDLIVTTLTGYTGKLRIALPLAKSSAPAMRATLVGSVVVRASASSPVVATPGILTIPGALVGVPFPATSSDCNHGITVGLVGHAVPVHKMPLDVGLKGLVGTEGSLPMHVYLTDATVPDLDTEPVFNMDIVGTVRFQPYGDPLEHPTLEEISENLTLTPIGEWD